MCLQCTAESTIIIENIVPGYHVAKSTIEVPDQWPQGHYGIMSENDPLFILPPIPKPPDNDEPFGEFDTMVAKWMLENRFYLEEGYDFISACVLEGYNRNEDGAVMYWFCERLYNKLQEIL